MMLSPTNRLLVACCSTERSERKSDDVARLLTAGVNYEELVRLAGWHRLLPIVYQHLSSPTIRPMVPVPVLAELQTAYLQNAARNLYLRTTLQRVLDALARQSIDVVLLKGAALLQLVYDDAALRPMIDIDLLVRASQLDHACQVAGGLGFGPVAGHVRRRSLPPSPYRHHHAPALLDAGGIVSLELHHHVISSPSALHFDINSVWDRAGAATVGDVACLLPAPSDLLVHLCMHFVLNRRYRSEGALGQLCDVSETVRRLVRPGDWDVVTDDPIYRPLRPSVALALVAVSRLLGTSPPGGVVKRLVPEGLSEPELDAFIHRRVLRFGSWLALEQLSWRKRPLHRLFPTPSSVVPRTASGTGLLAVYATRLATAARLASTALRQPAEVGRELALNRWLRALTDPSDVTSR